MISLPSSRAKEGTQPARVAHHWERSAQPERALPWYVRAAEVALTQGSNDQAKAWLTHVVGRADPESELHRQAAVLLEATQPKT